jgi:hypothetical protein
MNNRQRAAECEARVEESYQRSDTDGFLSQWANGLEAQRLHAQADIDERSGVSDFPALFGADGERIDARLIHGQYGMVWILDNEVAERFGRRFIPYDGSHEEGISGRSRVQSNLGLVQQYEEAPAKAIITGSGTGLSGNAWVMVIRTDGK